MHYRNILNERTKLVGFYRQMPSISLKTVKRLPSIGVSLVHMGKTGDSGIRVTTVKTKRDVGVELDLLGYSLAIGLPTLFYLEELENNDNRDRCNQRS